ncbi:MAG: hypothetical protein AVO33_10680 [delta proteobacterium ML8_F1]|nr:MAG: hypothetical protein AVO33_10680 [delta proteobacterium ML8_F1]
MDYEQLTPMMRQYFEIKNQYKDYILMYRLGDFYEMFFDDAKIAARELELTLTGRNAGLEEKAPLCGVPYHSAQGYISKLVNKGYKVAICEQREDPRTAKGLVKREVVKLITPGTLTDPEMLTDSSYSYILCVFFHQDQAAVVYADISTFEIRGTTFRGPKAPEEALQEILKLSPREVLLLRESVPQRLLKVLEQESLMLTPLEKTSFSFKTNQQRILDTFGVKSLAGLGIPEDAGLVEALGALIEYIKETQKVVKAHFGTLKINLEDEYLILDQNTLTNLELFKTMRTHEKKGSLLWVLDHTKTAMGQRTLKNWMLRPLKNRVLIEERLDRISLLIQEAMIRDDLIASLKSIYDIDRLVSKLIYSNMLPRDLIALKHSLEELPRIKQNLKLFPSDSFNSLEEDLDPLLAVTALIEKAIEPEPPALMKEGGYIKSAYHETLGYLRNLIKDSKSIILSIEAKEKAATGIKNLKIKYNRVFGYYIEVTKSNLEMVPENYIRKQTLAGAERYITEDLKAVENDILSAHEKILSLENRLYTELIEELRGHTDEFLEASRIVAQIDVLISLALAAKHHGYCRPEITNEGKIEIAGGRHPVIEKNLQRENFIPNDTLLNNASHQLSIITGPNMAGKSTYLRQVALICLMAQMGSYVPAAHAVTPILDRIFTRVGASDDLSQGQSTFMVEMSELANILRYANARSLILLDEIGRGTSTYDGLAIAWAVVEFLTQKANHNPMTLFATHYHELTELEGVIEGVKNYHITVEERAEDILFLRKIAPGYATHSYGIQVARLAGIPKEVVQNARGILNELEKTDIAKLPKVEVPDYQVTFFRDYHDEIIEKLSRVDLNETTPLEALNILSDLLAMTKKESP